MPIRTAPSVMLHGDQIATQSTGLEEFSATFGEALRSGPTGSLFRLQELEVAQEGHQESGAQVARFGHLPGANRAPDSPLVSQQDALQRIRDAGLDGHLKVPEGGIRQRALQILIDRKNDELRRQTILAQSPGGSGRVGSRLAGGLIGSLVDPTNIALAFVPVVGEARYARLLEQAGSVAMRTGVRVGVGAAEGIVGGALAEPLNYAANVQQQADYDAYDSFQNIAGGAFFGAALHGGAGLFGDMIRPGKWAPKREPLAVERDAINGARAELGRVEAVDPRPGLDLPDPIARERAIVLDRLAEGRPLTREAALTRALDNLRGDIEADLIARTSGVAEPNVVATHKAELAAVTKELDGLDGEWRDLAKRFNDRPGVTRKEAESLAHRELAERRADLEARKARSEAIIAANKEGADAQAQLGALKRGEAPDHWKPAVEREADRLLGADGQHPLSAAITQAIKADPFAPVRPYLGSLPPEVQQGAFRAGLAQALTGRPIDVSPVLLAHAGDLQGAAQAAMRNASEVAGADHVAAQAADARLAEARVQDVAAITEAANDAEALWREQAKAAGLEEDDLADDVAQVMTDTKARVSALKIAALCAMRAG